MRLGVFGFSEFVGFGLLGFIVLFAYWMLLADWFLVGFVWVVLFGLCV